MKCILLYIYDKMDDIKLNKLNILLKVAIQDKSFNLSNKTLISMSLIDKLNNENIDIIYVKIKQLNCVNDVIINLLHTAKTIELSDIKKRFLLLSINNTNMYILNQTFEKIICKHDISTNDTELKTFINNIINIYNEDIINKLLELKCENIVFNIFRKSKVDKIKEYVLSVRDKFADKNIQFYLNQK